MPLDEFGFPSDLLVWQALLLTLLSFAVGVLGGFVGLALGTIRLPALLLLGIPPATAAGTNIAVSTASALTGSVRHLREGRVHMPIVLAMGAPSMVGAFIGGFHSQRAPESLLVLAVGTVAIWQGVEFLARGWTLPLGRTGDQETHLVDGRGAYAGNRYIAGGGVGFVVGLLGGAVGLILGTIRLPALVRILRVDPRLAAGTNLVIGFFMGSMGWVGHLARGQVDFPLVVLMGTSAMAGSYLGARLTGRVSPRRLTATMGLVLVVVGVLLLWRAFAM